MIGVDGEPCEGFFRALRFFAASLELERGCSKFSDLMKPISCFV